MSAHTPGPWEYRQASNYCGFAIAPRGTLPTLAAVERPRGNPHTLNVTAFNFPGDTEANARLIAAAPELLDALRIVMSWIDNWDPNFTLDAEWPADRDSARAAIAKATQP